MSCKTLSLSTFNVTCLLLIWITVTVRPVLSARELAIVPVQGSGKVGVNGHHSPKGPPATVGLGVGWASPSFPSPRNNRGVAGNDSRRASSSLSSSLYNNNSCTPETLCETSPTGEVSCTTVSNCNSISTQQPCSSETCYSTTP